MKEKTQTVSSIKDGTVIDHVPVESGFKVLEILRLNEHDKLVSFATNLPSKAMKKKALVKVSGRELSEEEFSKVAVLAPKATINIIKDYKVKLKKKVALPKKMESVIKCPNPACITNQEVVQTTFTVVNGAPIKLRCGHCERVIGREELLLF